jgi:hypothetical protein
MNNVNTSQQKAKKFLDDNYGWILLISGVIVLSLITNGEFFTDIVKGWNDGRGRNKTNFDAIRAHPFPIKDYIELFFGLLMVLLLFGALVTLLGNFFYHLFFRYILQKTNILYIAALVVWFLVLYNFTWELWYLVFNKNNAFEKHFSSVKQVIPKKDFVSLLTDYRQNYATLATALILLSIFAYVFIKNHIQTTKTQAKLIAQKSQAELMALKAQINPHFLFNVLNNLYGSAIVEDSPKTSEGILQLSSIMRHVVEGTKNERIDVEKEIRFLNDFIELNKMRIPNRPNIRIITEIYRDENPTMIAPLLVIPYLENAFKYGISITEECFIEMSFRIENQQLSFICKNSSIKINDKLEVGTGTGLDNTKRRLDLYYPTAYQLSTNSSENSFVVNLKVNL